MAKLNEPFPRPTLDVHFADALTYMAALPDTAERPFAEKNLTLDLRIQESICAGLGVTIVTAKSKLGPIDLESLVVDHLLMVSRLYGRRQGLRRLDEHVRDGLLGEWLATDIREALTAR